MAKMYEISCNHCGGSISLDEEWDRTPNGLRAEDWITKYCTICGGTITAYKRWIDAPTTHNECMDGRWLEQPCTMCFGPMSINTSDEAAPQFHARCSPEFWYDRACTVCGDNIRLHIDWQNAPVVHRECERLQWYEKECGYCGTALRVHVEWTVIPDAHLECEPTFAGLIEESADATQPDLVSFESEQIHITDPSDVSPFFDTSWDFSNSIAEAPPADPCECEHPALLIEIPAKTSVELSAEYGESDTFEDSAATSTPEVDLEYDDAIEPISSVTLLEVEHETVSVETDENISAAAFELEINDDVPAIALVVEDESAKPLEIHAEDNTVVATEPSAPAVELPVCTNDNASELNGEHDNMENANLEAVAPEIPYPFDSLIMGQRSYGETCYDCGKNIARLRGTQSQERVLCLDCHKDKFLMSGAIASLRKNSATGLYVTHETRTRIVTEQVVVVLNAETDELVAEVKLCDDGVFSPERAAVAYDPATDQRFSKTVFGHKGLFSALYTAETFDAAGNLIHHTGAGRELPLDAKNDLEKDASNEPMPFDRYISKAG